MKLRKKCMTVLLGLTMTTCLAGCGGGSASDTASVSGNTESSTSDSAEQAGFDFSGTATSEDTDRGTDNLTVFTRTYEFDLKGKADNTFTMTITPSGEKNADYGKNAMSIVTDQTVGTADAGATLDYSVEFPEETEEVSGTWSYEEGWGYTLTFDDGTEVVASYRSEDKSMYFDYAYSYDYNIVPTDSSLKTIAKKDTGNITLEYRDKEFVPDANYKLPNERYATHVLKGYGTFESWTSEVNIYCQDSGECIIDYKSNFASGTEKGTWKLDETTHLLTLNMDNNKTIRGMYDAATDSYAIVYYTAFIKSYCIEGSATEDTFKDKEYTDAKYTYAAETMPAADQGNCNFKLYLYEDGNCYIENTMDVAETITRNCAAGTWTEDAAGAVTINIDGVTYTGTDTLSNVVVSYTNPYYGLPWGSTATADAHEATVNFTRAN